MCLTRFAVLAALSVPVLASAAIGDPDPAYGIGGLAIVPLNYVAGGNDQATSLVVLPDGRVVLGGFAQVPVGMNTQYEQTLVRLTANGSGLDPSFGAAGVRRVSFGNPQFQNTLLYLHRLPDGKLIGAGEVDGGSGTFTPDFSILRLSANGTLDTTFDLDGRRLIDFGGSDGVQGMSVYPDGRILLSGYTDLGTGTTACGVLTRLNANGSTDAGFGSSGSICVSPGGGTPAITIATGNVILPDERIVLIGATNTHPSGANYDMFASGLLSDGSADTTFGSGGTRLLAFDQGGTNSDFPLVTIRQPDGRLLLAGRSEGATGDDIAVARLLADGTPDPDFGTGGRAVIALDLTPNGGEIARAIALQDDGRIVLAGRAERNATGSDAAIVLRLMPDGSLDPSFGTGGVVVVSPAIIGTAQDTAFFDAMVIANGVIHAAGGVLGTSSGVDFDMLAVRLVGEALFRDGFESF